MKERIELTKKGPVELFFAVHHALKCLGAYQDDYRGFKFAKVLEDRLVCTDGHCLGVAKLPGSVFKDGFYIPVRNTKTTIDLFKVGDSLEISFPDAEALINKFEGMEQISSVALSCSNHHADISGNYTKLIREMPPESTIKFDLFAKFCGLDIVKIYGADHPVAFSDSSVNVYVMPMRT